PRNLSVLRPDAAAGFGITLAFGLLAATVADQTFWQKGLGDPRTGSFAHVLLGRCLVLSGPDLAWHARAGRHCLWADGGRHRGRWSVCGVAHRLAAGAGH